MKLRTTAILLALAATACNRTPAANNAVAPASAQVPAPQSNVVIAPPMAPPAIDNRATAAPTDESASAEGCASEIGQRAADQLVLQCRDVSPATRPPCNAANSCAMISEEIARGCGMLGAEAPEFCPPAG